MNKEHRLIGYNLDQLNQQRLAGGVMPLTSPVGTSPSSIQTNVANQDATHQAAISGALAPTAGYSPSYTNLSTPGGNIGYSTADWIPATDSSGNPTVAPRPTSVIPTNAPAGYVDVNGLSPTTIAGVQESQASFAQRKAAAEQQNAALMQEQALKQQEAQRQAQLLATSGAASSAAAATGAQNVATGVANRLASRLSNAPQKDFITQQRSLGKTDQEIQGMLASGLGNIQANSPTTPTVPSTAPTNAPSSTTTPKATPTTTASSTKPTAPTAGTTTGTPAPTVPNVGSSMFRQLAATESDPVTQILMNSYADMIDATPAGGQTVSYSQYVTSPDAQAISKSFNQADAILAGYQATVNQSSSDRQAFNKDQFTRQDQYLAQQQENQTNQLTFQQHKDARDLAEANRKQINTMSNALALEGGFGSAGGNAEIQDAILKGDQAISDLNMQYGFKKTDVSLAFTQAHNQALDSYKTTYLDALDKLDSTTASIASQRIANEGAKQQAISSAFKDYNKTITDANLAHAKAINDATQAVYTVFNQEKDNQRAQETLGWNILNTAIDNYGSLVPKSIIDRVQTMLPKGTNIQDIINTPTFAERSNKLISGRSGGGSGGGIGGSVTGTVGTGNSNSTVTKQQVADAIDRVARNFGKSVSERADYRDQMLRRLNSGESLDSLTQSLSQDYWTSVDAGTAKDHIGKQDILGGIGNINSYAEQYGINSTNDGILGPVDARINSLTSHVGLSSPAYNDIASVLSNMRATIVHEKYGSRVTDSELALARTYIPDMNDKGNIFFSKLNNLKSYTDYLDQRTFNEQVGLPLPPPPKPIVTTGTSPTGTGRFSASDFSGL